MPPAKRTTVAEKAKAAVEHVEEICRACWPHGWPHLSHSASCEHGTFVRDPEATGPEQTPAAGGDTKTTEDAPPAGDKTEA